MNPTVERIQRLLGGNAHIGSFIKPASDDSKQMYLGLATQKGHSSFEQLKVLLENSNLNDYATAKHIAENELGVYIVEVICDPFEFLLEEVIMHHPTVVPEGSNVPDRLHDMMGKGCKIHVYHRIGGEADNPKPYGLYTFSGGNASKETLDSVAEYYLSNDPVHQTSATYLASIHGIIAKRYEGSDHNDASMEVLNRAIVAYAPVVDPNALYSVVCTVEIKTLSEAEEYERAVYQNRNLTLTLSNDFPESRKHLIWLEAKRVVSQNVDSLVRVAVDNIDGFDAGDEWVTIELTGFTNDLFQTIHLNAETIDAKIID